MPFIDSGPVKLHYEESGTGAPVVFCHGLAGHCERELPWTRALAERGYRVVVYSARGHGKSSPLTNPDDYTFEAMRTDLARVMDALEIERAIVGGGSMGAATTLSFTLSAPDRVKALIQLGPAFGSAPIDMVAAGFSIFADYIDEHGANEAIDKLIETVPLIEAMAAEDPGMIDDMREQWNSHVPSSIVAAMRGVPKSRPFTEITELESVSAPTLIVASAGDPIHPLAVAEEYSRYIPNSELRQVPLSPPLYRDPQTLAALVGEFCDVAT
ncbi:MAG: hypothetical protein DCC49_10055 [Acidobacteria bacterium]|nr:MAG: hypothetical protein DCC49_10055 [Acidobacteriota bacterium]